jgi:hypothetical protein
MWNRYPSPFFIRWPTPGRRGQQEKGHGQTGAKTTHL